MKSLLEIWVLRTSSLGWPGARYPQEKLWDTDLQKCHIFNQISSCPQE